MQPSWAERTGTGLLCLSNHWLQVGLWWVDVISPTDFLQLNIFWTWPNYNLWRTSSNCHQGDILQLSYVIKSLSQTSSNFTNTGSSSHLRTMLPRSSSRPSAYLTAQSRNLAPKWLEIPVCRHKQNFSILFLAHAMSTPAAPRAGTHHTDLHVPAPFHLYSYLVLLCLSAEVGRIVM